MCDINTLLLYRSDDLRAAIRADAGQPSTAPAASFELRSTQTNRPISRERYASDGSAILFLGRNENETVSVYRLDARSGQLSRSSEHANIFSFDASQNAIVFIGEESPSATLEGETVRPVSEVLDRAKLTEYLRSGANLRPQLPETALFMSRGGDERRLLTLDRRYWSGQRIWISPDSRHAVALIASPEISNPREWDATYSSLRDTFGYSQFVLVDLQTGTTRSMFRAPACVCSDVEGASRVAWSNDSRQVILIGTGLPDLMGAPRDQVYAVVYDVPNGQWTSVAAMRSQEGSLVAARWDQAGTSIRIEHRSTNNELRHSLWRQEHGTWRKHVERSVSSSEESAGRGIDLALIENANTPPYLTATLNGRTVRLVDPTARINLPWRADATEIEWREGDARARGLLMMPRNLHHDSPPPLVIQAYHNLPDRFRPDGPYATAYAAQPLVAQGFAVLQVDIPSVDHPQSASTPREGELFVRRIDSAVGYLHQLGLIDSSRVGLVGFSRGGFRTLHYITRNHDVRGTRIGAAVIGDGWTGGYSAYLERILTHGRGSPRLSDFEGSIGSGQPFWQDRAAWLENSPAFNVQNVEAPLLYTTNYPDPSFAAIIELFSAFDQNGRPLELMNFPNGAHPLQRASERFVSLQATVDWLVFWLLGREDSDPAKADQYERWRRMRSAWQVQRDWEGVGNSPGSLPMPVEVVQ